MLFSTAISMTSIVLEKKLEEKSFDELFRLLRNGFEAEIPIQRALTETEKKNEESRLKRRYEEMVAHEKKNLT
ncbi:MAG: hypothetical protein DI535_03460 [Citrobacter freundii]|nr:MAG: hypothetical protein DI535_03460 [Citrobacter freundii]